MTREEAIEIVQAIKFIDDFEDYSDRLEIALDMAIEALKRQDKDVVPTEFHEKCMSKQLRRIAELKKKLNKQDRPHGEWKKKPEICYDYFYCSECGYAYKHAFNFCPNCGADMREEGEEGAKDTDNR